MPATVWSPCNDCLDPLADALVQFERCPRSDLPERVQHLTTLWSYEISGAVPRIDGRSGVEVCRAWLEFNVSVDYAKAFVDRVQAFMQGLREWEREARLTPPEQDGGGASGVAGIATRLREPFENLSDQASHLVDHLQQMSAMLRGKMRRQIEASTADPVARARAIRMTTRPGTFEEQRLLAVEVAEELTAGIEGPEPQRTVRLIGALTLAALGDTAKLVMMSRAEAPTPEGEFVGHVVRAAECRSRVDQLLPSAQDLIAHCGPSHHRIQVGWRTGGSALDAVHQLITDVHGTVHAAAFSVRSRFGTFDPLLVDPKPDPIFSNWRKAAIKGIREHLDSMDGLWLTIPEVLRDLESLAQHLRDEIDWAVENSILDDGKPGERGTTDDFTVKMISLKEAAKRLYAATRPFGVYKDLASAMARVSTLAKEGERFKSNGKAGKNERMVYEESFEYWLRRLLEPYRSGKRSPRRRSGSLSPEAHHKVRVSRDSADR